MSSFRYLPVLLMLLLLTDCIMLPDSLAQKEKPPLVKLHAVHTETGNTPKLDTVYHFLSEQAEQAYASGELASAEKLYGQALADAETTKAPAQITAALHTNLAAVLRDERKFVDSEKHFQAAIEIERNKLQGQQAIMDYTANQYSAMLIKSGRETESEIIKLSTKNGFQIAATQADAPTSIKHNVTGSKPKMCNYTITVEPDEDRWAQVRARVEHLGIKRINGVLTFLVESGLRPFRIDAPLAKDTPLWANGYAFTETTYVDGIQKPIVWKLHLVAPCMFKKTTISGRCQWHETFKHDDIKFLTTPGASAKDASAGSIPRWE